MKRLRTSFSRLAAGDVGVSNLEKVTSLPVQARGPGDSSGGDELANNLVTAASVIDVPNDLRRQMYQEAHAFKQSPLFTQKVRMENKLDEHELLRVQLEALDYQEKHGVLLTEGDFYYRYPQSFDIAAKPKADGGDGQLEWSSMKQTSALAAAHTMVGGLQPQGSAVCGGQEGDAQVKWYNWLQRQKDRGWYGSSTLVYSTLFGAVVGASNFTTYWQQLQIWRSSMFFLPYLLFLVTVGLPTLQLELVLGNLLRGAAVKQNTQQHRWLVGLGVMQVLTAVSFVILTAVLSGQLLIYFVASFTRPQPWQVTVSDMDLCNTFHGKQVECDEAGHGVLCSYVPEDKLCIASPTGKATLHYLEALQPSTLDRTLDPDALRPNALATLGFVWLYILAYMWRGLFKAGFLSSIFLIIAMVLCATLAVVSFFVGTDGSVHVTSAIYETFAWGPLLHGFFDAAYAASLVRYMSQDLCLGCCILGTVTSYTKIGFNTYPCGVLTCIVEFFMALVPFASLLSIVGNLQAVTGIPLSEIIRKTGHAPSYFVVFPAAFEKVTSPYLFALFFYGGVFLINTQVAAIAIHAVFNAFLECRLINNRWRRTVSTVIVIACYCLSLPFCSNNQQVRLEYATYLVESLLVPISVFCSTLYFGWFVGFQQQSRLVGTKACILFGGLCFIIGASYLTAVFSRQHRDILPIWLTVLVNAVLAAAVAFFIRDPEAQAQTFKERFLALFLGGIRDFSAEISRVTLFFPQQTMRRTSLFGVLPTLLCGFLTKPFFVFRPSTYWCVCIKHFVPFVMAVSIVDALYSFGKYWESMAPSPNMRNFGAAIIIMGLTSIIITPFLPKVRDWVRPVPEDYMSTSSFPSHKFVPTPRVTLFSLIPALFREHLKRSKEPSASVKSLVADYKKQKLPFLTSFQPDSGVAFSQADLPAQQLAPHNERALDMRPMPQPSQQLSGVSKSSEGKKAKGVRSVSSDVISLRGKFHMSDRPLA